MQLEDIEFELIRKKIRHMYLYVRPPDGRVRVTAPLRMKEETIRAFVSAKAGWIREKQGAFRAAQPPEPAVVSGESVRLWGERRVLEVVAGRMMPEPPKEGTLRLAVRPGSTPAQRKKALTEWYRAELKRAIPAVLEKWQAVIGVRARSWNVRDMHTRWGTCNVRDRRVWFSLRLVTKPPVCLEYLTVHELLHLIEPHHSARFYALLDQFFPGWREVRSRLNAPD